MALAALSPKSVFITGCSRGIGLEFVKQILELPSPPDHLFATCRNLDKAQDLSKLAKEHDNLHLIEFDVTNYDHLPQIVKQIEATVKDFGLNLVINNAGAASTCVFGSIGAEDMRSSYEIHSIAPVMIAQALVPLLSTAAKAADQRGMSCSKAAIVNISSMLGSCGLIGEETFKFYPYNASKAALNNITRCMAFDLKKSGILTSLLHPGWVQTGVGGSLAPLLTPESVRGMLEVLAKLNEAKSGSFYGYDGKELPW